MTGSLACSSWFFVRYADPDPHLRLRFRGDPRRLLTQLLPALCEWAADEMADGTCHRFALDTYDREVERYGGAAGLAAAEAMFAIDSATAIEMLGLLARDPAPERLALLLASVDQWLGAFGMDRARRMGWCASATQSRRSGGEEFRQRKNELRSLIGHTEARARIAEGRLVEILDRRARLLESPVSRLVGLERSGQLGKPLEQIVQSIVHMHCNRLGARQFGIDEQVISLLARTYRSLEEAPLQSVGDA